jgi:EpsI family protein
VSARETVTTLLLALALLLSGATAWVLALRPPLTVDASPLDSLPSQLGPWQSEDVALEGVVESMLAADYNLQRRYSLPFGEVVWLYFGYYGTERGGRPEHTPEACFRAHGWKVEEQRVLDAGNGLRVNEMVVSFEGERQLVHYWFRSFRRTGLRGGLDQMLDHLIGRVFFERADGSLVRVSTGFEEGELLVARSRLLQFATAFDQMLGSYWPRELPEREVGRAPERTPRSARRG